MSGSVSRVLYPRYADGDHYTGPAVAGRLCRQVSPSARNLPAGFCPGQATGLLGLAGGGVFHAVTVTDDAVRSYRTISPLPKPRKAPAVSFLWHCPAGHPGRSLAAAAPCPARTFLRSFHSGGRPTHSEWHYRRNTIDRKGCFGSNTIFCGFLETFLPTAVMVSIVRRQRA